MSIYNAGDESATLRLGRETCRYLRAGSAVFLHGEPGAGKTTFVRGILSGFGYDGVVTSPTYTLAEIYHAGGREIVHLDLYRIRSPAELETIGIRDMMTETAISLIEWPAHGDGFLPRPDLEISIEYAGEGRNIRVETRSVHHPARQVSLAGS